MREDNGVDVGTSHFWLAAAVAVQEAMMVQIYYNHKGQ